MIINGGARRNARFFAKHLANGKDNERVTICEIRNLAALTIPGALQEMEAIALGTQCRNFFYHANLNPQRDEALTSEQWTLAVDLLERNLALVDHARFMVEHSKKDRIHRHVIWSRINVARMRAVAMTDDYYKHQETARQIERALGLKSVRSVLGPERSDGPRPARRPKAWESFRGQKSGIDPRAMTEQLTDLLHSSSCGSDFASALSDSGYTLAVGDKGGYCVLDAAGHVHSLRRRLNSITAAELAVCLQGLDVPALAQIHDGRTWPILHNPD